MFSDFLEEILCAENDIKIPDGQYSESQITEIINAIANNDSAMCLHLSDYSVFQKLMLLENKFVKITSLQIYFNVDVIKAKDFNCFKALPNIVSLSLDFLTDEIRKEIINENSDGSILLIERKKQDDSSFSDSSGYYSCSDDDCEEEYENLVASYNHALREYKLVKEQYIKLMFSYNVAKKTYHSMVHKYEGNEISLDELQKCENEVKQLEATRSFNVEMRYLALSEMKKAFIRKIKFLNENKSSISYRLRCKIVDFNLMEFSLGEDDAEIIETFLINYAVERIIVEKMDLRYVDFSGIDLSKMKEINFSNCKIDSNELFSLAKRTCSSIKFRKFQFLNSNLSEKQLLELLDAFSGSCSLVDFLISYNYKSYNKISINTKDLAEKIVQMKTMVNFSLYGYNVCSTKNDEIKNYSFNNLLSINNRKDHNYFECRQLMQIIYNIFTSCWSTYQKNGGFTKYVVREMPFFLGKEKLKLIHDKKFAILSSFENASDEYLNQQYLSQYKGGLTNDDRWQSNARKIKCSNVMQFFETVFFPEKFIIFQGKKSIVNLRLCHYEIINEHVEQIVKYIKNQSHSITEVQLIMNDDLRKKYNSQEFKDVCDDFGLNVVVVSHQQGLGR